MRAIGDELFAHSSDVACMRGALHYPIARECTSGKQTVTVLPYALDGIAELERHPHNIGIVPIQPRAQTLHAM